MKSELAKARDKWLQSDEGKKCCNGTPTGQYLQNRLEAAFIAGWGACVDVCEQVLKDKP